MSRRFKWRKLVIEKQKVSISRRINLLFFIVVSLFTILVLRLAYMQIQHQEFYKKKLTALTTYTVKSSGARGQIYDAKGVALVENEEKPVVAFTRSNTMTAEDIKKIGKKLSAYVDLTETTVTDRQKRDYYLADSSVYKKVVASLPRSKKYDNYGNSLTESTIYSNAVAAVSDDKVNYSDDELKLVHLFSEMNAATTFGMVKLTTADLSEDQIAYITANKYKFDGISITTKWNRKDVDSSLSDVIGTLSTEKTGLPKEEAKAYLKKGYSLNDRVGTSYLEKQYESDLQGKRTVRKITVNKKGKITSDKTTSEGGKGDNLKLTIDLKYQEAVENILKQYFSSELSSGRTTYSEGVYAVALEPSTGKVLAIAGLKNKDGQAEADNLGTITDNFTPGSVVKGATISSGWENNALSGNEVLYDQEIAGIKSWFTSGLTPISAVQALEYSSNTYMVQIALRMMGQDYKTGDSLMTGDYKKAMKALRATYAEYGLGTNTGLDLPESEGYSPSDYSLSSTLMESFGQFDAYTPMQLAQYISTVANGGTRISPHIVDGVYSSSDDGGLGNLVRQVTGEKLNQVNISADEIGIIQNGFYNVVNSSSGYATGTTMRSSVTTISGKTGTAETYAKNSSGDSVSTYNLNAIAYDANKKIAVAVMYPHVTTDDTKVHQNIARDMIDTYVSNFAN